jgi:hypothetical protein
VWFLLQLLYCQRKRHPLPTGQEDGCAPQIMYMVVKTEILSLPGIIYDTLYSTLCRALITTFSGKDVLSTSPIILVTNYISCMMQYYCGQSIPKTYSINFCPT